MSVWIILRFVVDDALTSVQKYHWTIASLFHIYTESFFMFWSFQMFCLFNLF